VPFDAYLFDLDGTLVDSLADLATSMNHVLRERGLPDHPEDAYRRFVGDGVTALVERALPREHAEDAARVAETEADFRRWYGDHMLDRTAPYPGVRDLVSRLVAGGIPCGVLSNKPHDATEWLVDRLFPGVGLAPVFGAREGVPRKPDPGAALEAMAVLGAPAERTAFVGDSGTDMATARNAGMVPVGVAWGFRTEQELVRAGARWVCRDVGELEGLPERAPDGDR